MAEVDGQSVELKELINKEEWNACFTKEGKIDMESLSQGE